MKRFKSKAFSLVVLSAAVVIGSMLPGSVAYGLVYNPDVPIEKPLPMPEGKGDVNGDGVVDDTDCEMIKEYYFKKITEFPNGNDKADINDDGKIDINDMRHYVAPSRSLDFDRSGSVNVGDFTLFRRWLLDPYELSPYMLVTCDLNKDGKFNVGDYTKLRRIILGIEIY